MNKKTLLLLVLNIYSITLHSGDHEKRKRLCSSAFFEQNPWGREEHAAKLANTMHRVCAVSAKRSHDEAGYNESAEINLREPKKVMGPEDYFISQIRYFIDTLDKQNFVPLLYINRIGKLQTEDNTFRVTKNYKENLSKLVKQPTFQNNSELHDLLENLEAIEKIGYKYLSFG